MHGVSRWFVADLLEMHNGQLTIKQIQEQYPAISIGEIHEGFKEYKSSLEVEKMSMYEQDQYQTLACDEQKDYTIYLKCGITLNVNHKNAKSIIGLWKWAKRQHGDQILSLENGSVAISSNEIAFIKDNRK